MIDSKKISKILEHLPSDIILRIPFHDGQKICLAGWNVIDGRAETIGPHMWLEINDWTSGWGSCQEIWPKPEGLTQEQIAELKTKDVEHQLKNAAVKYLREKIKEEETKIERLNKHLIALIS